jgi:hypothetical protein
MDVLTKLIQQAARKPGVGEVRLCYFDTGASFYARALPDSDRAMRKAIAEFEVRGVKSITPAELSEASEEIGRRALYQGHGSTPEGAVRALLVEMSKAGA